MNGTNNLSNSFGSNVVTKGVTIGIPAYNEQGNIGFLLNQLLTQKMEHFNVGEIMVYSDGSTDQTNQIVKSLNNPKILLIEAKDRKGVAHGQNELIRRATSEILVLIDADITIKRDNFLEEFLQPFLVGKPDLLCCSLREIEPSNFFEEIIAFGVHYKNNIFENYRDGKNFYTCHGAMRAFSRNFYSNFQFKEGVGEDMYSYFYCISNGYTYAYNKNASAFYKLPDNFRDHLHQSFRFFVAKEKIPVAFNINEPVPSSLFVRHGWELFKDHPVLAICYVFVTTAVWFATKFRLVKLDENVWEEVKSSKTLREHQ